MSPQFGPRSQTPGGGGGGVGIVGGGQQQNAAKQAIAHLVSQRNMGGGGSHMIGAGPGPGGSMQQVSINQGPNVQPQHGQFTGGQQPPMNPSNDPAFGQSVCFRRGSTRYQL